MVEANILLKNIMRFVKFDVLYTRAVLRLKQQQVDVHLCVGNFALIKRVEALAVKRFHLP